MKNEELKQLIEKYLAGNTSETEEYILYKYASERAFPVEYKEVELMILSFDQAAAQITLDELESKDEKPIIKLLSFKYWQVVAASILLLALGYAAGMLFNTSDTSNDQQITSIRQEVSKIKNMLMIERLNDDSPSERIMAAYETSQVDTINDAVLKMLVNKLHYDEDVNVRIAAAEALFKYGDRNIVRQAYIKTLDIETMPVLKIKVINLLVQLKEKRAIPELQKLVSQEASMPVLRQKAAEGISKLL